MDNYLKKAEENFDNSNYKKTIEYCDKMIAKGLYLSDAYRLKALSQYFLSKNNDKILPEALKNINIALEEKFNDDEIYYTKSLILERMKRYEEAVIEINKAIFYDYNFYHYYFIRGKINDKLNRKKEAINDFSLSLEIKEDVDTYNERGELYMEKNEYQLAREDFQRAVELDDKDVDAWRNLGNALDKLDLYESAISCFNTGIELEPENDFLYYRRGWVKHKLKRDKEALADIDKAIESDPEYSFYYVKKGVLYMNFSPENNGEKELHEEFALYNKKPPEKYLKLAEKSFQKAVDLDATDEYAYRELLGLYNLTNNYEKQIVVLDILEILAPDDERIYSARGLAKMKSGDYENAIIDFTKFLEFEDISDEDIALVYGNRGVCYTQLEKYEEALPDLDKAVEMLPNAMTYVNRGVVKNYLMNEDKAIEDYKKALELEPDFHSAYFNTGISQYRKNLFEKATENYFTAYEIQLKKQETPNIENYIERFYDSLKGLFGEKKYKKTVNICNKIIKLGIKHEKFYNLKGAAKIMLGKYKEAMSACLAANTMNPDFEPVKINLKIIKQKLGKQE